MKTTYEEGLEAGIPKETLDRFEQENPYRKFGWFFGKFETLEHTKYNRMVMSGWLLGRIDIAKMLLKILTERGISKKEIGEILNQIYGKEIF